MKTRIIRNTAALIIAIVIIGAGLNAFAYSAQSSILFRNSYSDAKFVDSTRFTSIESAKTLMSVQQVLTAPSTWAAQEVTDAIRLGIAPEEIQESYQSGINRIEFAKTAVYTISAIEGITYAALIEKTDTPSVFTDSIDPFALCAYALGIIHGRGEGIFDPFSSITREEAAAMLSQTLSAAGVEEPQLNAGFADQQLMSDWAKTAVSIVSEHKIMVGTGDNLFDPKGGYTREQALASFLRLLKVACPEGGIRYVNRSYGFAVSLPSSWRGFSEELESWDGQGLEDGEDEIGPQILVRHPLWTKANPRQDVPVMIFTIKQWEDMTENEAFHIGAAPMNPSELGRNSRFVFGLPARYNYAFSEGYEEVEDILDSGAFSAFESTAPLGES